jgi:CO dehydrogenase/acetyl-CoA synthase beta subunit
MNLFDDSIEKLQSFLDHKKAAGSLRELKAGHKTWPEGERGNIVLASDTAVELGSPEMESVSFMVWTEKSGLIKNNRLNLIGPDISEKIYSDRMQSLPFGKVVLLKLKGMDENNCYERHRQIDMARYDLNLRGYMMRAASQYMREWSRVSREAARSGFSFAHLAGALSAIYSRFEFIEGVEYIFVTSSTADVRGLASTGSTVEKRISAMNKMATELTFDCDSCDYTEICAEVEGLRSMHKNKSGR